ncbi:hypothetical protein Tco_0737251 [Tanacetum coccineum]
MCCQPLPPPLSSLSAKLMIMALKEYGYQSRRGIRVPKKWSLLIPVTSSNNNSNNNNNNNNNIEADAVTLLKRMRKFSITQDIGACAAIHIFNRIGISVGKEVDIGLGGGCDKPLRMIDFVPGRAMIEATHRKRVKYEAKCADIGYSFLPISLSSLGELEKDAMTLLKRIQKFFVTQDIRARAAVHIFNRISFVIAKGVGLS